MAKKIRLSDLSDTPCYRYRKYIAETYGEDGWFDPVEVFRNVPGGATFDDVHWLLHNCEKARTHRVLDYMMSLTKSYKIFSCVIANYRIAQTKATLKHYLSLQPSTYYVKWLMYNCEYARRNAKMLQEYIDNLRKM